MIKWQMLNNKYDILYQVPVGRLIGFHVAEIKRGKFLKLSSFVLHVHNKPMYCYQSRKKLTFIGTSQRLIH